MKKILITAAILALVASTSFAATSVSIGSTFGNAGKSLRGAPSSVSATSALIAKTSTGVDLGALVAATGAGYSVVTQHKNGTKAFGTSYDSTAIYTTVADGTPGTVILSVPTATDTTNFSGTSWKPM